MAAARGRRAARWFLAAGSVWSGKFTKLAGLCASLKAGYTSVTKPETAPGSPLPSRGLS